MEGLLELKDFTGEVKDVDLKGKRVSGYLSKFGNLDHDLDVISKGAFSKSLMERRDKIFFLNQHNWSQPHGTFEELKEDELGLYFVSKPMIDTSYSMDAMKLYEAGIIKEHSIGFQTVKSDYDHETNVRTIKEVKLYEGSNVTMGSNPETPFLGFKSMSAKDVNEMISKILGVIRNGNLTDESFVQLEIALKQLQRQGYELAQKTLGSGEPSKDTLKSDTKPLIETIRLFSNSI